VIQASRGRLVPMMNILAGSAHGNLGPGGRQGLNIYLFKQ